MSTTSLDAVPRTTTNCLPSRVRTLDRRCDGQPGRLQQMLVDPEGLNDWVAELEVDLAASRTAGQPVLRLLRLGSLV